MIKEQENKDVQFANSKFDRHDYKGALKSYKKIMSDHPEYMQEYWATLHNMGCAKMFIGKEDKNAALIDDGVTNIVNSIVIHKEKFGTDFPMAEESLKMAKLEIEKLKQK